MCRFHFSFSLLISVFVAFFIMSCSNGEETSSTPQGRTLNLTEQVAFLNDEGNEITTVRVALADTPNKRNLGLMDVYEMPRDAGMLFIFDDEVPRSFWMANTPLSLDIVFVNTDMEIVRIRRNTTPFSEAQILSDYPAKFVVEVHAGFTAANDIQEGMKVHLPNL